MIFARQYERTADLRVVLAVRGREEVSYWQNNSVIAVEPKDNLYIFTSRILFVESSHFLFRSGKLKITYFP